MRKILFRGLRVDNKEWIEGYYIESVSKNAPFAYITTSYPSAPIRVYTITVGQYTGLIDKNEQKIFEGDIVNINYGDAFVKNAVIEYSVASFYASTASDYLELDSYYEIEVIGNIHDNLELLG